MQVMVGRPPPREAELAAQSLMSLLREGGQWDDDDDLRAGRLGTESKAFDSRDLMIHKRRWDQGHPLPRIHEVSSLRPVAEREALKRVL